MQTVSSLTLLFANQRGKFYDDWIWLSVLNRSGEHRAEWDVLVSLAALGCNLVWKLIQVILKSGLEESKGCGPYTFLCTSLLCLVAIQLHFLFLGCEKFMWKQGNEENINAKCHGRYNAW